MRVHSDAEIDATIAQLAALPGGGLIAPPSAFNAVHRHEIIAQAWRTGSRPSFPFARRSPTAG
jgi:hypothetical protein